LRAFLAGNLTAEDSLAVVDTVLDTLQLRERLAQGGSESSVADDVMKTCVRRVLEGEVIEWDCLHEGDGKIEGDDDEEERPESDASMEDLTEEEAKGTHSIDLNSAADDDDDESGEDGDEKAENNSCISIYFQS